jgi:putative phosphoesterase
MRIGVISDTHGYLDPRIGELFANVKHILHAGDIGDATILHRLEAIAPVTAVAGNNDLGSPWPERAAVNLGGRTFLVQHIVDPRAPLEIWGDALERTGASVVVFGHTHRAHAEWRGERLFFNPGYAGRPRFALARSAAVIELAADGLRHEFLAL